MASRRTLRSVVCRAVVAVALSAACVMSGSAATAQDLAPEASRRAEAAADYRKANELAASGAFSRAIPLYERALKLDPDLDSLAYFNLGEVYRAKGNCKKASFFFAIFQLRGSDEEAKGQAKKAIEGCRGGAKWATLSVRAKPQEETMVTIDGYPLAQGEEIEAIELPPGTYTLGMEASDHVGAEEKVTLKAGESERVEAALEAKVFHGMLKISANVEGATVRIFEGADEASGLAHNLTLPQEEGVKLTEGRHFVEVTKEGYRRWIRNVKVLRDDEIVIEVSLQRGLPGQR